ncbi:MAG TPA: response regulator, partial [Thermoanaerobaculia bacterium]|nr:response regulator [Thermoanaerobaculia bacterium]
LLDLNLPGRNGLDVCRDLRAFTTVPLIMITGRVEEIDRLLGLEMGADDYLGKPFEPRELLARIRNVLRRAESPSHGDHDQLAAVVSEMRVRHDDRVDNLTAGETAVLTALIDHAPAPMTIVEIAQAIGANRGTVESRIKSLRKKLGPARLVSRGRLGYQVE